MIGLVKYHLAHVFCFPDNPSGPHSAHTEQGSRSINLLSGIVRDNIPPFPNAQSFKIQVENVCVLTCKPFASSIPYLLLRTSSAPSS